MRGYEKRIINKYLNGTIGYCLCSGMDSSPISYWRVHEDVSDILINCS